jgi:hypothetical protein
MAAQATLRCLTGYAIGEVLGMVIGTAFVITTPVNKWMISRGKGHVMVHQYHH